MKLKPALVNAKNKPMQIMFQIIGVVLLGVAAYLYSTGNSDWTFAAAVVGICALFLGMRFAIKRRLNAAAEIEKDEDL